MTAVARGEVLAAAEVRADEGVPRLVGFIESDFAPLVHAAVRACVGEPRTDHLLAGAGDRAALVLGSRRFDTVSLETSVEQVARGRVSPILFYQVVPTAVLGLVARDYGITGAVSCVAATDDARAEVRAVAEVLLADGSADRVLALTVELGPGPGDAVARAELLGAATSTDDGTVP